MSAIMPVVVVTRTLREAMSPALYELAGNAHPVTNTAAINNPIHLTAFFLFTIFSLN
jgi:hypothetical protein